jgi:hypothetical protein
MCTERKLHSNWRSPADTPSLSPIVVAVLRVRYARHRASPYTFFSQNLSVNRGSTVYIIIIMEHSIAPFLPFTASLCDIDRGMNKLEFKQGPAVDMDRFCTLKPLRLRQIEEIECRGLVSSDTCWYSGGTRWSRAVILKETDSVLCGDNYSIQ